MTSPDPSPVQASAESVKLVEAFRGDCEMFGTMDGKTWRARVRASESALLAHVARLEEKPAEEVAQFAFDLRQGWEQSWTGKDQFVFSPASHFEKAMQHAHGERYRRLSAPEGQSA